MKDRIFNIVGPSGSGKTTIAKELEKLGYNIIHSYTTRPPRYEGEWGHTFIDKLVEKEGAITGYDSEGTQILKAYEGEKGEMIAFFNDYSKGEVYFATKEQYQGKGTSIYVVDPDGAEQVKRNVKDAEVVTIFLMADEGVRASRLSDRAYESRGVPNYVSILNAGKLIELQRAKYEIWEETESRLTKDAKIFSKCKCDYVVDANRSIEEVLADVKEIIGGIE